MYSMETKKIISYVCCEYNMCEMQSMMKKIEAELPFKGHLIKDISALFPLLADPNFHTDYITISIEDFYKIDNVDVFEMIQTLDTLIKCTVYKPNKMSPPTKRNTKIVAVVDCKTPIELIKEVLEFSCVSFLTPGGEFAYDDIRAGIKNLLVDTERIPQAIKKMLKIKSNNQKDKSLIYLTPRQKQILELVSNRGISNKVIAKTLHISESTVKLHMGAILKKYNVKNRTQLAVFSKKIKTLSEV